MYNAYFVDCDAVFPPISVVLGGKRFYLNPVDLINKSFVDEDTGLCMSQITDGGEGPFILGDVFMQNVLTEFDQGRAVMRFTPRPFY